MRPEDSAVYGARDLAQRRLLVALAESAPATRRRPRPLTVLAVFALAGGLTGAAVSATAAVLGAGAGVSAQEPTTAMLAALVPGDTRLVGEPFALDDGSGATTIDVGPRPEGATTLSFSFGCRENGSFTLAVDGAVTGTFTCDGPGALSSGEIAVPSGGAHELELLGEGRFALWASWSAPPVQSGPSVAQTAALADGRVTDAEYREAFARYESCLAEAGFTAAVSASDPADPRIRFTVPQAAVDSGADAACYAAEFAEVDRTWQSENPDVSG